MRDAMGNQSFQTYERHGKIGTQIDAEGGLQYSSYNQFGERVKLTQKVTGGVDLVTDYSYDKLGRVETTSVANVRTYALDDTMAGNGMNVVGDGSLQTLTTRYVYDQLGRRVAIVDSAGGESRTRYDLDGNVVATGDQTGIGLTYSYDAFHHKILEVDGMGMTLSWQYDDEAKLVRYTDMSNAVVLYGYDGLGRKTTQTSSARGTDGLQQNLLFSYDKAGLLARIEDRTSRQVTTYEYDLAGNRVHEKTVIVETKPATAAVILPTDPDAVTITELYEVLLGRHPDPAGLEYWRGRYNGIRGGMFGTVNTVAKLAEIMLTSDEARETFKSDGSVGQFVDKLFSVAVGRQPSATQRASYISQFDNGYDRRGRVVMQFLSDLRPAEREVLNAKIDAALHPVARPAQDVETVVQDNRIEFDDLGRMRVVEDMRSHVEFYYDANGNRLEVRSSYRTAASGYIGVEGDLVENDVFNTYDKANRQLFVNAVKVNGELEIGKYGHKLSYDSAGQRISDTYRRKAEDATTVITDNYRYDNVGRMITTTRDGDIIDFRQYDIGGRLIRSGIINGPLEPGFFNVVIYKAHLSGWDLASNYRTFHYDAAGRILRQKERDFDGKQLNDIKYVNDGFRTTPMGYDNAGRLRGYFLIPAHSELVEQYNYSITYSFMDSAQQSSITVKRDNTVRTTTNAYDQNGNLIRVTAPRMDTEVEINRVYVNDASGHVLRMTAGSEVTSSLVVNDQLFASYGGAGADAEHGIFANTFSSATDVLAGGTSQSVYVVQSASETLQTIAKMVWGDSSLWYLIADANGLSTETLTVGMPLQIPTRVSAVRNNYSTFKPYDRSSIDGDIGPTLPAPPKGGCGTVGMVILVIVAVVVSYFTAGAATAYFMEAASTAATAAGATAAGAAAAGAAAATATSTLVVSGAIGGAVGSLASQVAGMAMGMQDGISWKGVAMGAIGGAVGGAVNAYAPSMADVFKGSGAVSVGARAALTSALTQGIGSVTGLQEGFSWRTVAASGIAAGLNTQIGGDMNTAFKGLGDTAGPIFARTLTGIVSSTLAQVVTGGKVNMRKIATDAFGNAIGEAIKDSINADIAAEKNAEALKKIKESFSNALKSSALSKRAVENYDAELTLDIKMATYGGWGGESTLEARENRETGVYEKIVARLGDLAENAGVALQVEQERLEKGNLLKRVGPTDPRQDLAIMGGVGAGLMDILRPLAMGADFADAFSNRNVLMAALGNKEAQQLITSAGTGGLAFMRETLSGIAGFASSVLNGEIGKQIKEVIGELSSESPKERASAARIATSVVLGIALGGEGGLEVANLGLARLGSTVSKFGGRVAKFVEQAASVEFVPSKGSNAARRIAAQRGSIDFSSKASSAGANGARASEASTVSRRVPQVDVTDEFMMKSGKNGSTTLKYGDPGGVHGLIVNVDKDGILGFDIRSPKGGSSMSKASGTDMFLSAMQRLEQEGVQVTAIRGTWIEGTDSVNAAQYLANVKSGMNAQQAAANTWTGRMAASQGFTNVGTPKTVFGTTTVHFGR